MFGYSFSDQSILGQKAKICFQPFFQKTLATIDEFEIFSNNGFFEYRC